MFGFAFSSSILTILFLNGKISHCVNYNVDLAQIGQNDRPCMGGLERNTASNTVQYLKMVNIKP